MKSNGISNLGVIRNHNDKLMAEFTSGDFANIEN